MQRRGFSAAEVIICVLILGVALIPIYSTFISSSHAVSSSRFGYMAMQVARETIEEMRATPFDRMEEYKPQNLGGAPLFKYTAKFRSVDKNNEDPTSVNAYSLTYPDDYGRIGVDIKVEAVEGNKRLKKVSMQISWQETGGKQEKPRSEMLHFVTYIGYHSVDPEVQEP